jgi:hypothetical protein
MISPCRSINDPVCFGIRISLVSAILLLMPSLSLSQRESNSAVPNLTRYAGTLKSVDGFTPNAPIQVRFAVYAQSDGGEPLWEEWQEVMPDASGHFSVLLGSKDPDGIPASLFGEHEERWLSVQVPGRPEGERSLLVAVPYAFKARDAEMLAGHAASDFVTGDRLLAAVRTELQQGAGTTALTGAHAADSGDGGTTAELIANSNIQALYVEQDGKGVAIKALAKNNSGIVVQSNGDATTAGVVATSVNGSGVRGVSTATTGSGAGVQGISAANTGYGMLGTETSSAGLNVGVLGTAASTQGIGVSGIETASTGLTVGVQGSTASASGVGVAGTSTATTGATLGVTGSVSSPNGIAALFQNIPAGKLVSGVTGAGTSQKEQFFFDGVGNLGTQGGVAALGSMGAGIAAPQFKLHVVDNNFVLMRADGSSPIGTWLELNNTAGGHNMALLSTGSQNGEGAGNLTISDQTNLSSIASFGNLGTVLRTGLIVNPGANLSNVLLDGASTVGTGMALNNASGRRWEMISTSTGNPEGAGNLILFDRSDNITRLTVTHDGNVNVNGNLNVLGSFTPSGDLNTNTGYDIAGARVLNAGNLSIALGAQTGNLSGAQGNTFVGAMAGQSETSGTANTSVGTFAGQSNTTGTDNTFLGANAGTGNTTGNGNTALGAGALLSNTTGLGNIGIGDFAGFVNQTGGGNVSIGTGTGSHGIDQNFNTNLGSESIMSPGLSNSTAIGAQSQATQSNSLVLGSIAGVNGAASDTNVGIGTTAPQSKLHIVDVNTASLRIDGSNTSGASVALTSTNPSGRRWEVVSTSSANLEGPGNLIVYDRTDNITRMTFTGDGNVNILGNLNVSGTLAKGGGSFKIDHPQDPANKYLSHSFVESPDMMNIYNGSVKLDAHGEAWVEMPGYFEALNRDFQYQLTAIGRPAPGLYIARKIDANHFKIAGGKSGMEVSWQVTGVRHDAWAEANRIPVEEDKTGKERGTYLHPELFRTAHAAEGR